MPPIDDGTPAADPAPTADPTPTPDPAPAADPAPSLAADPAPVADPAPAADPAPGTLSFRDMLPDDLKGDPAFKDIDSLEKLAREHQNLQGLIGRKGLIVPADDAPQEARDEFFNAIGRPETVEGYDFGDVQPPEGMPWRKEADEKVTAAGHAAGATNDVMKAMRAAYIESAAEDLAAMEQRAAAFAETSEAALKSEWGGDYDANLATANQAVKAVFGDQLSGKDGDPNDPTTLRLMDGTHVMNHPGMAKAFLQLGKVMQEEGPLSFGGGPNGPITTPAAAKAEIQRIRDEARADPKHPYSDKRHAEHAAIHNRVLELTRLAEKGDGA